MVGIEVSSTVGEKGQVVIPKPVRDMLHLLPNTEISFSVEDNRIIVQTKKSDLAIVEEFIHAFPKKKLAKNINWDAIQESQFL